MTHVWTDRVRVRKIGLGLLGLLGLFKVMNEVENFSRESRWVINIGLGLGLEIDCHQRSSGCRR